MDKILELRIGGSHDQIFRPWNTNGQCENKPYAYIDSSWSFDQYDDLWNRGDHMTFQS